MKPRQIIFWTMLVNGTAMCIASSAMLYGFTATAELLPGTDWWRLILSVCYGVAGISQALGAFLLGSPRR